MPNYPFKKSTSVAGINVTITGTASVNYPNASAHVEVKAHIKWTGIHTYDLKIGPNHLKDQHTEKFTAANIPITVVLDARPDQGVAYVSAQKGSFVFWTLPISYTEHKGIHNITAYGLYAVIKALEGKADHTYVIGVDQKTGDRLVWNCGGAYEGGRELTQGQADGLKCDCISLRKEDIKLAGGMAGIRYGIDGVCHQAANRIMYPAGLIVSKARGWKLSSYIYGRLGLNAPDGKGRPLWDSILKRCMNIDADVPEELRLSDELAPIEEDLVKAEYDIMADSDGRISEGRLQDLSAERRVLQAAREGLALDVENGKISGASFAADMNQAISAYLSSASKITGSRTYGELLEDGGEKFYLVNPDVAERVYAR